MAIAHKCVAVMQCRSLNPSVDLGQIEGAFMMGLGHVMSEYMAHDPDTGRCDQTTHYTNHMFDGITGQMPRFPWFVRLLTLGLIFVLLAVIELMGTYLWHP